MFAQYISTRAEPLSFRAFKNLVPPKMPIIKSALWKSYFWCASWLA